MFVLESSIGEMGKIRFLRGFFNQIQRKIAQGRIADSLREFHEISGNRRHFWLKYCHVRIGASLDSLRILKVGQARPNRPEFILFQRR